jgi:DNA gyrase subunit A
LPEGTRQAKGQAIINLLDIEQGEQVLSVLPVSKRDSEKKFVFLVTKNGTVKKTALSAYESIRRTGIIAIKLQSNDILRWAKLTQGNDDIFLVSENGQSIRFPEKNARPMGRDTQGVRGLRLKKDDKVVGIDIIAADEKKADLLVVMSNGLGKKTSISEWHNQNRGGSGLKAANINDKTGKIITAKILTPQDESLILTSKQGKIIRLPIRNIPRIGRATQGVMLMRFSDKTDRIAAATTIQKEEEDIDKFDPNPKKQQIKTNVKIKPAKKTKG